MATQPPTGRRLLIVAVDGYADEEEDFRAGIQAQTAVLIDWLAGPSIDDGQRFHVARPTSLDSAADLRKFLSEQAVGEAGYREALFVYITGHGLVGGRGRHYLTFPNTDSERLLTTAYPTVDLITAALGSEAEHIMVLVDSCFAGSLHADLTALLHDLPEQRRRLGTVAVVTSGDIHDRPRLGEFTEVVALALDRISGERAGFARPHLSHEEWESVLKSVGRDHPRLIAPQWIWPPVRADRPTLCLPNPRERSASHSADGAPATPPAPPVVAGERPPGPSSRTTLGRGLDPGFHERTELLHTVSDFLTSGNGILVVTGSVGSGKSALLATAAARCGDWLDRAGTVVPARDGTPRSIALDLLNGLGPEPHHPHAGLGDILDRIRALADAAAGSIPLILDGLDEAADPVLCVDTLLGALHELRRSDGTAAVRLVVAVRSSAEATDGTRDVTATEPTTDLLGHLLRTLAAIRPSASTRVLRTDESSEASIAAYLTLRLLTPATSPYRGSAAAATEIASAVARTVAPSFLDARLAADRLAAAPVTQAVNDVRWLRDLRSGTVGLLRSDLAEASRHSGIPSHLLVAVLRATALAPGRGIPWADVWPAVIAAIRAPHRSPPDEVDAAIRTVCTGRLTGYLTIDREDGRTTYRPLHQRITEVLRDRPGSLVPVPGGDELPTWLQQVEQPSVQLAATHRRIAEALAALASAEAGTGPHPYLRRHLVEHADRGGALTDAVVPATFLPWERSGTLRTRLGFPLPTRDSRLTALTAAALVEAAPDDAPGSRAASIEFHVAALSGRQSDVFPGSPLRTLWAEWRPQTDVLRSPSSDVGALCLLELGEGRPTLAVGTTTGIELWTPDLGTCLGRMPGPSVRDLCAPAGHAGGRRSWVASAGPAGAAVWNLNNRQLVAELSLGPCRAVRGFVNSAGEHFLVAAHDGVHLWNPGSGTRTLLAGTPAGLGSEQLAVTVLGDGSNRLITASPAGVDLWDLDNATHVRPVPYDGKARAVTTVPGIRGLAVLSAGDANIGELWDLESDHRAAFHGAGRASRLSVLGDASGNVLLAAARGGRVQLWDLLASRPTLLDRLDARRADHMCLLSVGPTHARLATAGSDGVRIRESRFREATRHHTGAVGPAISPVHALDVLHQDGPEPLLVIGSGDRILIRQASDGRCVDRFTARRVRRICAPTRTGEASLVAVIDSTGAWWLNISTGQRTRVRLSGTDDPLVDTADVDGQPLLLFATTGSLDLVSADRPQEPPITLHRAAPRTRPSALAAFTPRPGAAYAAVGSAGTVEIVDLSSGIPVGTLRLPGTARVTALTHLAGPDGGTLVAAQAGRLLRWETGSWSRTTLPVSGRAEALCPLPALDALAVGTSDGVELVGRRTGHLHRLTTAAPVTAVAHAVGPERSLLVVGGTTGLSTLLLGRTTGPGETLSPPVEAHSPRATGRKADPAVLGRLSRHADRSSTQSARS
ncbi:AAA family ATPase [Kitasatospora purpeofusca]|uniref:AAA family ATPase n=1 Tax=Kitasatospora purpeofusca TaxID=67352 RepID=UPI0035D5B050